MLYCVYRQKCTNNLVLAYKISKPQKWPENNLYHLWQINLSSQIQSFCKIDKAIIACWPAQIPNIMSLSISCNIMNTVNTNPSSNTTLISKFCRFCGLCDWWIGYPGLQEDADQLTIKRSVKEARVQVEGGHKPSPKLMQCISLLL